MRIAFFQRPLPHFLFKEVILNLCSLPGTGSVGDPAAAEVAGGRDSTGR